jgi:hypothetical protein
LLTTVLVRRIELASTFLLMKPAGMRQATDLDQ